MVLKKEDLFLNLISGDFFVLGFGFFFSEFILQIQGHIVNGGFSSLKHKNYFSFSFP